eukprot:TRINITY_DN2316_c0_g1_i3.p1 TRINITY_DN2316_c0_g1~~TRINITY_DN2316_c0_g1_i3.p1  ORF type:complete len:417 (+),score=74.06 TRINITY_DN2316_c0_g1_i3:24-1253(+)
MSDVKDILGVSRSAFGLGNESKPKPEKLKRPEGMSREAFALLGDHAIIPAQFAEQLLQQHQTQQEKFKPGAFFRSQKTNSNVAYRRKAFVNQARTDGLELKHWVKCLKDPHQPDKVTEVDEGQEYPFAKFNKKINMYRYDDEEYENIIKLYAENSDWSREETDYLFDLCEQFDLRWVVIADRYDYPNGQTRSMEDLKQRYYDVAKKLIIERDGGQTEGVANNPIVKNPYNAQQERQRKKGLEMLMTKTYADDAREEEILEQAKAIRERRKREQESKMKQEDKPLLLYPANYSNDPNEGLPLFDFKVQPYNPDPGIYVRGQHVMQEEKASLQFLPGGQKSQKQLELILTEAGFKNKQQWRWSRAVSGQYLAARAEATYNLELRKKVQRIVGEGAGEQTGTKARKDSKRKR